MLRDVGIPERLETATALRERAQRVRRLMGGMTSKAEYERLADYAYELEARAARADLENSDNRN